LTDSKRDVQQELSLSFDYKVSEFRESLHKHQGQFDFARFGVIIDFLKVLRLIPHARLKKHRIPNRMARRTKDFSTLFPAKFTDPKMGRRTIFIET